MAENFIEKSFEYFIIAGILAAGLSFTAGIIGGIVFLLEKVLK